MELKLKNDESVTISAETYLEVKAAEADKSCLIVTARPNERNFGTANELRDEAYVKAELTRFLIGFRTPTDELIAGATYGINLDRALIEKAETVLAVSAQQGIRIIKMRNADRIEPLIQLDANFAVTRMPPAKEEAIAWARSVVDQDDFTR